MPLSGPHVVPNESAIRRSPFSRDTVRFLAELKANNDRAWFEANKHRYEALVLEPSLSFIESMARRIEGISKHLLAVPKRTGGSLMRVYRDTRFAHDKTPYKTNIGIQFRHERGRDVHAPGFYVHIAPDGCFLGAGLWHPEPQALHAIRMRIVEQPARWGKASTNGAFRGRFELAGDRLARLPRGFAADAPHVEDLKRKDFIAVSTIANADVLQPDFCDDVAARFKAAAPLMSFLCAALDLRY